MRGRLYTNKQIINIDALSRPEVRHKYLLTRRKLAEDGKGEAEEGATVDGMEVMR